jgi:gamma-glutamylputrescine oxidase
MTLSWWRRNPSPALVECDVGVVGAGICGLSAALHLQRRGLRTEVLERGFIGSGASTRNAGFLMRGAADNYTIAIDEYGRSLARTVWRLSEENLEGLRQEGIGSIHSVRAVPSVLLAFEDREHRELRDSLQLLREDGFEAGWIEQGRDALWRGREHGATARPLGALVNPGDASCHSAHVIEFLARKLQTPVREHQEVVRISMAGNRVELRTGDLLVRADRVLICTNAYAPLLLPQLEGVITPRRGQMLACRVPTGFLLDASYYANRGSEYFRQASDGTLVVGGCRTYHAEREVGYDDRLTPWVQGDIEKFARSIFGRAADAFEIVARWTGTMGFSPDGLPLVGPVPTGSGDGPGCWEPGRVWFCGGFTGHGMSLAYRVSRMAVEAMLDDAPNSLPLSRVRLAEGGVRGV